MKRFAGALAFVLAVLLLALAAPGCSSSGVSGQVVVHHGFGYGPGWGYGWHGGGFVPPPVVIAPPPMIPDIPIAVPF